MNMKASQKFCQNVGRVSLRLVLGFIALSCGGCFDKENEQQGDPEPKQAQFQVTATPKLVTLDTDHRTTTVTITGVCRGKEVPTPCGSVDWTLKQVFYLPY